MVRLLSMIRDRIPWRKRGALARPSSASPLVPVDSGDARPQDIRELQRSLGLPVSPRALPTPGEVARGIVGAAASRRRRREPPPPPPPELDEYGLPKSWRRDLANDPFHARLLESSNQHWRAFERWCGERSSRAFPAEAETVLNFLTDPSVSRRDLFDIYMAIDTRHDAYYWNEDANPCYLIHFGYGVRLSEEGSVSIADHWRVFDEWCKYLKLTALPASEDTLLRFLREPPLLGVELYRVWKAVGERHASHCEREDLNPCLALERDHGVIVTPEGVATIPLE